MITKAKFLRRVARGWSCLALGLVAAATTASSAVASTTDDYPATWRNGHLDQFVDSWGLYSRECTSFVAFRLSTRNDFELPWAYGNAGVWGSRARSEGYAVDGRPAVGAVAWWSSGHVAWVESVGSTTVVIEEYNVPPGSGRYNARTIGHADPDGYIHFKDLWDPSDPDGGQAGRDITWWTSGTVQTLRWPAYGTSSFSDGFNPGDWHATMDYNNDGLDDVVFYRRSDQSLRVLLKKSTGGYSGHAGNPIRTGVGAPTWAGVGDLDGDGRRNDIHWWQGNTIFKFIGPTFGTSSATAGMNPAEWHGVMDYNGDGRDDIVLYRKGDQSLRIVLNRAGGGFSGYSGNPIRSGVGAPTWAGVGDLDGDGRRNDIHWWQGNTIFKFIGPTFGTSSATAGMNPAEWHGVLDYNGDGRDDIVIYRQGDQSLRIVLNRAGGGYSGYSKNPLRTGLPAPVWAGVGILSS